MEQRTGLTESQFIRRVLIVIGLVALFALAWMLRNVLLMVFGAVVVATLFRAFAALFQRFRVPYGLSLAIAILTVFAIVGGAAAMFGAEVVAQTETLTQLVPQAWEAVQQRFAGWGLGQQLEQMSPVGQTSGIAASAGQFLMSLGGGLADALLIIVGGIFIAASPRFYTTGIVKLIPGKSRNLAAEALHDSGTALKLWLKAQLLTMVLIGLLTGLGLWMLGVPSALALGLLAALLEFVPYVGPILAALPAIIIAFATEPQLGLWTIGLYLVIQQIEGNLLAPLLQQWAVELPGAVLLFSLFACGTLFGPLGIVFAAPLTVVVYVMVKRLYVQEALDTPTPIPGEDRPSTA